MHGKSLKALCWFFLSGSFFVRVVDNKMKSGRQQCEIKNKVTRITLCIYVATSFEKKF